MEPDVDFNSIQIYNYEFGSVHYLEIQCLTLIKMKLIIHIRIPRLLIISI